MTYIVSHIIHLLFKRPGVAGTVLQTPLSLIYSLSESSFVKISSKHLHSLTVKPKKLKFLKEVHLLPTVMCQISCVKCHMSHVTCHVSLVMFFFDKLVKRVGGGSVINGLAESIFFRTKKRIIIVAKSCPL